MEILEITFYLSFAAMAGVLQEQLSLLLLLRIRRRKIFFGRGTVRNLCQGFRYGESTKKDMRLVNKTTCNKILEMRKCFSCFS